MFEGSAATPVQTHTAILPGSKFRVVLMMFVVQDALRSVFKVWPEVRSNIHVDGKKKLHVQAKSSRKRNRSIKASVLIVDASNEHEESNIVTKRRRKKERTMYYCARADG